MRFSIARRLFGSLALASMLSSVAPASGQVPEYAGIFYAVDVESQFRSLARRGDALAFHLGEIDDESEPSLCKHLQGMARLPGTGKPYLFVSRSGNDPGATCITGFEPDYPGNLFVVRLDSRDSTGERLRSNRLWRDWVPSLGGVLSWTKPPDPGDGIVANVKFANPWPAYMHPGGMQIVDDVLAVAVEAPYQNPTAKETAIVFVDVADPDEPVFLSQWPRNDSESNVGPAGLVGLTPVLNPDGPGLRYLMLTTGGDNGVVRLWRSRSTTGEWRGPTDLRDPDLDWQQLGKWTYEDLEADACSGGQDWPEGRDAFQSLNFVREASLTGPLYVVGGRNTGVGGQGNDWLALYRMDVDQYGNPGDCLMKFVTERHVTSFPYNGHGDSAALSAAGGTYVSPSGELIVYATEYENDGPWEYFGPEQPGRRTVRFVEWRNINVVRPDSPTLKPSVETMRTVEVAEGGSVVLTGVGRGPMTKAWIQLFEDDDAGQSLPSAIDSDDWLQIDYEDWSSDHFDDFGKLDATTGTDFNDNAGSWRWFAPQGCTLRVNEDPVGASTGLFPGRHTRTLHGDGLVHRANDLDSVRNDDNDAWMNDKISSVQFDQIAGYPWPHPRCADYYSASITVAWDLDGDGNFEKTGNQTAFSAATLDGPSEVVVRARGRHPTDTTALGASDPVDVKVVVRNVAPVVTAMLLRDSLGNLVGSTVPFVLTGLPVSLQASFTDPGRPDHQTAAVDWWGDGRAPPDTQFASFSDAYGGATGQLHDSHAYAAAGSFMVRLRVTDDDNDFSMQEHPVRVVTPAQAVAEIGALIDALIAAAADGDVRRALEGARHALLGSRPPSSQSGALNKILAGNLSAAEAFLGTAIDRLERAQAGGADVASLISLLEQVSVALDNA